jgi:hypothetical protein
MSAPEFTDLEIPLYFANAQVGFDAAGPINLNLGGSPMSIAIVLTAGGRELPLGTTFGPLRIQVTSSNSQAVRVPAAPVEILPGQSRATVALQAVGRGDAAIALSLPPAFNGTFVRQNLAVTVR